MGQRRRKKSRGTLTKPSLSLSMQILAIRYAMRMLSGSARSLAMCCSMRSPSRSISLTSCRSVAVLTLWFQIMSAMGVCDLSPVNLCLGIFWLVG